MEQPSNTISAFSYDIVPACSFQPMLNPAYETIRAECDPWILELVAPPVSAEATHFLHNCLFPLFCCLTYPECQPQRVALNTKLITWFFLADSDDDDLSVRGCAADHVWQHHRSLILDSLNICGNQLHPDGHHHHLSGCSSRGEDDVAVAVDTWNTTKGLASLHDIWKDISRDMPLKMQSRFLEATRQYLDANMRQARFRSTRCVPSIDDYIKLIRRPVSFVLPALILLEYGLGIELDEETLQNELFMQLLDTAVDHITLYNDLFSFKGEVSRGDYFNLPSVIFEAYKAEPGYTFADAVQEAVRRVKEVDKLSAQLMAEAHKTPSLVEKGGAGVEAYLRGVGFWMAGNVEWSHKTALYSPHEGVVRPVHGSQLNQKAL